MTLIAEILRSFKHKYIRSLPKKSKPAHYAQAYRAPFHALMSFLIGPTAASPTITQSAKTSVHVGICCPADQKRYQYGAMNDKAITTPSNISFLIGIVRIPLTTRLIHRTYGGVVIRSIRMNIQILKPYWLNGRAVSPRATANAKTPSIAPLRNHLEFVSLVITAPMRLRLLLSVSNIAVTLLPL